MKPWAESALHFPRAAHEAERIGVARVGIGEHARAAVENAIERGDKPFIGESLQPGVHRREDAARRSGMACYLREGGTGHDGDHCRCNAVAAGIGHQEAEVLGIRPGDVVIIPPEVPERGVMETPADFRPSRRLVGQH